MAQKNIMQVLCLMLLLIVSIKSQSATWGSRCQFQYRYRLLEYKHFLYLLSDVFPSVSADLEQVFVFDEEVAFFRYTQLKTGTA